MDDFGATLLVHGEVMNAEVRLGVKISRHGDLSESWVGIAKYLHGAARLAAHGVGWLVLVNHHGGVLVSHDVGWLVSWGVC